jgi:thioredoxin 1
MRHAYLPESITREQADDLPGATVVQFGTDWCGYCRAAESVIEPVLEQADDLSRILVEDGKGRPLGRSYRVKLWPTLVFLADGKEVARVVRPWGSGDVAEALEVLKAALATA